MAHGKTASEQSASGRDGFDGLARVYSELLDDAFLQRLAASLAEHLNRPVVETPEPKLLDAHAVARLLACNRAFVYEHQAELGAIRLGAGPKARLRFGRTQVEAFMVRHDKPKAPEPPKRRTTRPRARAHATEVKLLPIRGRP